MITDTTMAERTDNGFELLRGRQEIADYIRASLKTVDKLIDLGVIKVYKPFGLMYTTRFLINRGFEVAAESNGDEEITNFFTKGEYKKGKS
jgi:hypothetical protein